MKLIVILALAAASIVLSQPFIDFPTQVKRPSVYDVRTFQFTRTAGAGASGSLASAGAKAITLVPCPNGVNGSDTNHYVYVSQGVGTPEAVLITGGTCTSALAAGGTLSFTTANSHTGTWALSSATGGIQEALSAIPAGSEILVNSSITAYGSIALNKAVTISCSNTAVAITSSGITGQLVSLRASNIGLQGCTWDGGAAGTEVIGGVGAISQIRIENNVVTNGGSNGISLRAGTYVQIKGNRVHGNVYGQINIGPNTGTIEYITITGNFVDDSGCSILYCGAITVWGQHVIVANNKVLTAGNGSGGVVVLQDAVRGTDVVIANNAITLGGTTPFECIGLGRMDYFTVVGNTCDASAGAVSGAIGIEVNASDYGTVQGNTIFGNGSTPFTPIFLESTNGVNVTGNAIRDWGSTSSGGGIFLLHTNASRTTTNNLISNNVLIQTSSSSIIPEIKIDTLTTGTVSNNVISGNTVIGNATSGHACIHIANSGSATSAGHSVVDNLINTCDIGIKTEAGTSLVVQNNVMRNVTTKFYDTATTTKIVDTNGVPFSFLGSQANGSQLYVTDSTIANPCAGSGAGAIAKRLNGAWVCN